jgi:hypothetical protein
VRTFNGAELPLNKNDEFWSEVKKFVGVKKTDVSKKELLEILHDMGVKAGAKPPELVETRLVEDAEKQLDDFVDTYVKCKTCAHFEKELFGAVCTMPETGPQELGGVAGEGMCEEHIFTNKNLENELDKLVNNNLKRTLSEMENFAGQFDFEEGEYARER